MLESIPPDWRSVLAETLVDPRLNSLEDCVESESATYDVYPKDEDVFRALRLTPYDSVMAVIIGQDPYHRPGQADGLAFSVPPGEPWPPSLRNILEEYARDLGRPAPATGSLARWAEHGVLLLNTYLTVRRRDPLSHSKCGWRLLTGAIVQAVNNKPGSIAFLLWGARAQDLAGEVDDQRHIVIRSSHPSPLSAHLGFNDSRPFTTSNQRLAQRGLPCIEWDLSP